MPPPPLYLNAGEGEGEGGRLGEMVVMVSCCWFRFGVAASYF